MNTPTSTDPPNTESDSAEIVADSPEVSEGPEVSEDSEVAESDAEQAPPKKLSRFRQVYQRYRAKGKWFVVAFVLFYLVRDTILYIILPWYLAKGGISLFDWLFEN